MATEKTVRGRVGRLQRLLGRLNGNREELPHLETSRARLEALLAEAQEAADRQAQHTAAKQEASQQFQTALAEGERLATVLQLSVKSHYGIRSEKLADFGLQPFRGRRPRRVSPELKPPAPAPAPAPAPEASRA